MKHKPISFNLMKVMLGLVVILFLIPPQAKSHAENSSPQVPLSKNFIDTLSEQERAWLTAHPVIRVFQDPGWPPAEFTNERGEISGISEDYLQIIEQQLGVKFERIQNLSWLEGFDRLKRWDIDMTTSVAVTPQRTEFWAFTQPYLSIPIVIATQMDVTYIADIQELFGKKVAVVENYAIDDWLTKDFPEIQRIRVKTTLEGIKMLQRGEVFAFIDNLLIISYYQAKMKISSIKITGQTPYVNAQCMAVRKDWAALAGILQKTLESIPEMKRNEIYRKWLPARYKYGFNYRLFWQVVGVFAMILLALALWNQKLLREIKSRRMAEEALHKSEKNYQSLFNNAQVALFRTSIDGKLIEINKRYAKMAGYATVDDCMAEYKPGDAWTEPGGRDKFLKILQEKGFLKDYETKVIRRDGTSIWILFSATLFRENGFIEGSILEITDRKQAEEEKIQAQKIAGEHEKLALVGQIAGKMAHDFNNVLGIIMGNTELSLLDCKDAQAKKTFELIYNQTIRGKNLTRNLVAFAKDQEPKQEFFRINEKIDLVINLLKKDLEGIELIREDKPGVPDLLADPGMIEHALVNLMQNSIHALCRVESPRIIIRTHCRNQYICLEIEDNGCGIPPEHMADIYNPSFTLKGSKDITDSYRHGIHGTGYGMSNVKKYIEQHKGLISVESELGMGTKFTISLPVIEKELTPAEKAEIQCEKLSFAKYILLVEDETDIADIQYRILTQPPCHHKVDIAHNGQVAMDLFDRNKYDLVSLDYILPGNMNGMAVYYHIRATDKSIPILFISGNIEFLESIKALKQKDKRIDHLSKPCPNKDYINSINGLCERTLLDYKQ